MPVYTLNPSHTRSGTHKASASHSLRERVTLRRNSASSADGSETYSPTSSSSSSSSSSSTQRSRAATSAATAVANAQARRYAAEASGYMGNPRAKTPTRKDELMRLAHEAGYHVETYSPGDGVTRYRFFDLAEMDRKGVSMREMSYFGPLNGVDTVLGLAAAKKWLSKSHTRRHNPLSEDGMTVSNPKRPSYKMVGVAKPRSRSGGTAQKAGLAKGQSLMARAAAAYRAGEYASMQDALRGVARKRNPLIPVVLLPPTPPPKKTLRGAPVENPRRKLPKSGEGKGIVSRAERGIGTKYRTMREGMLLEGGDVMLLPHRLPGHEGKGMADLSEAGREYDYEYNDAKPILDLLAATKAPMLRYSTLVKKLKEEGMSVDEVYRGASFLLREHLLTKPSRGHVALAKKNSRAVKRGTKHTGSRTVAQSNAARAMKLFHSGQASSLAEAWDIIRSGR